MLVYLQIVRWQIHNMKKRIKYLIIIFCLFAFCNITYHSLKSASLKKDCSTHIDLAIQVDEKYRNEPSDANRNKYIMELKKEYTIIMVTHNMQQAARISDNTAFFLLGEVVEYDKTEKLFSMPKDRRTEDYITGRFG